MSAEDTTEGEALVKYLDTDKSGTVCDLSPFPLDPREVNNRGL